MIGDAMDVLGNALDVLGDMLEVLGDALDVLGDALDVLGDALLGCSCLAGPVLGRAGGTGREAAKVPLCCV